VLITTKFKYGRIQFKLQKSMSASSLTVIKYLGTKQNFFYIENNIVFVIMSSSTMTMSVYYILSFVVTIVV